jgi:hypothetical protein
MKRGGGRRKDLEPARVATGAAADEGVVVVVGGGPPAGLVL